MAVRGHLWFNKEAGRCWRREGGACVWRKAYRKDEERNVVIIQEKLLSSFHVPFFLIVSFKFDSEARVWALRLPLQTLVGWKTAERRAEGRVKIIVVGKVGRGGVNAREATGGAGGEIAPVGEDGWRGGIVDDAAGVWVLEVKQGAAGAGGGRGGWDYIKVLTHLHGGDLVDGLCCEERLWNWERIQPFLWGGKHSDYNIHPKNHTTVSECVYVRHTLKLNKLKGELALCTVRTGFTSELKCIFRIFCLNKGQNHGAGGIRKTYLLLPLMQPLTSVLISPSNCLNFTFSLQKLGCPLNKKASNQLQSKILGTCTRCLSICVGQTDSYSTMGKTALIIKMLFSFCSVWGQLLKMSHS